MRVEVVAGFSHEQVLIELDLPKEATVEEAVMAADLQAHLPELVIDWGRVGIFGRLCPRDQVLGEGDRVEVYRPLSADPKEVRRELASLERARKNTVV